MRSRLLVWTGGGLALALLVSTGAGIFRPEAPLPFVQPVMASSDLPGRTDLELGFEHLYNLQLDAAHAHFREWMDRHPGDPLGPAAEASAYLFGELHRMGLFEQVLTRRLPDETRRPVRASRSARRPDATVRREFYRYGQRAVQEGLARLQRDSNDQTALLALTIGYGAQADYVNMVERRPWASLPLFKKSNLYAQRLLRLNPGAYDAWAASGFTEYLAGSLPFYTRWVVRFDSVKGDKRKGIRELRLAAAHGRFLRPYAKMLLAAVYLRENNAGDAARLVGELRAEFPDNPLFCLEVARLAR